MTVRMPEFIRRHWVGIRGERKIRRGKWSRGRRSWEREQRYRFIRRGGHRVVEPYDGAAGPPLHRRDGATGSSEEATTPVVSFCPKSNGRKLPSQVSKTGRPGSGRPPRGGRPVVDSYDGLPKCKTNNINVKRKGTQNDSDRSAKLNPDAVPT